MCNDQSQSYYIQLFQLKALKSYGATYQNLFSDIMRYAYPGDFQRVSPQGPLGDEKNDGFRSSVGAYYQVYAPNKFSEGGAVKKIKEDFSGLHEKWSNHNEIGIREFYFVINTEHRIFPGAYPTTLKALAEIKTEYGLTECKCLAVPDLEDIFIKLSDTNKNVIVGYPPSLDQIGPEVITMQTLRDVIDYIFHNPTLYYLNSSLTIPNIDLKIKFNKLEKSAGILNECLRQIKVVDTFFDNSSDVTRDQIRNRLNAIYLDIVEKNQQDSGDDIFGKILNQILPKKKGMEVMERSQLKAIQDSAVALMAYFFETCDIFKEPV